MAIEEEDDGGGGIPEWVVTFGDMMSLLLTFFIMLVSLSEIKEEKKFQALVESIKRQLGHTNSLASLTPGPVRPRSSPIQKISSQGRAKRLNIMRGGAKVEAPQGDDKKVQTIRQGEPSVMGTRLTFREGDLMLPPEEFENLQKLAEKLRGKPQQILICGHTSMRPIDVKKHPDIHDHYEFGFRRAKHVYDYFVNELDINPRRIIIQSAGKNDPLYTGIDYELQKQNPRVEVTVLSKVVKEIRGHQRE